MSRRAKLLIPLLFSVLFFSCAASQASAQGGEYKAIIKHLKTEYRGKQVKIPFMWLARFAVSVVRPAGVKSFSLTIFENLQFSSPALDREMQLAMKNSFGGDWSPIFRSHSRAERQQAHIYMREDGGNVKLALVTIDKNQAAVIRATLSPEKLAAFIDNPKIFGISFKDGSDSEKTKPDTSKAKEDSAPTENKKSQKADN